MDKMCEQIQDYSVWETRPLLSEHHLFFFSEGKFPLSTSRVELSKLTNENIIFY